MSTAEVAERLGEYVPFDVPLIDEDGNIVEFGSLIQRPTVLSLVYHSCPSVCRPLLEELTTVLGKMNLEPGKDYDLVTVSFDENDTPESSRDLKKETLVSMDPDFPETAWRFLTAEPASIERLTESVGFAFKRNGDDFAHPTTIIVLSKDRMIARYMLGAEFLPADLKMAIYEASEGRTGPTIAKFFRFCFSYDPEGRRLVLNITRIAGTGMLLGLLGFVAFLTASGRRRNRELNIHG